MEIDATGGELRRALFGSWLDAVAPGRALLIQTDQSLAGVAFAILPGQREPLGIEHPVSVTTLALPPRLADSPESTSLQRMLIIDASELNVAWKSEYVPVAGAEREIAGIQSELPAPADVIRGTEVTASSIRRLAAGAGILHFIGHAVNTSRGISLLLPGTPTPLGLTALREAGFHAPHTVVLAACSTGESQESETFGPDSLAAAFLFAGSAEVIASLWNVDSESTADFMAEFYRQRGHGSSSGTALQNAMKNARASDRYRHPYYWGAFARFVRV
jgi:CHAT domain-containing protein